MNTENKDIKMLEHNAFRAYSNILCFSTQRSTSEPKEAYSGFNCSPYCNDDKERVEKNISDLCLLCGLEKDKLVFAHQTHSNNVICIDDDFISATSKERQQRLEDVDAIITNKTGYCITISTADCVPLALYDTENKAIAVIHAGWRGTVNKIVESTVKKMCIAYGTKAKDLIVSIGPSISLDSFEVGDEVYEYFKEKGFDMNNISALYRATNKWHIDLWKANEDILLELGVRKENINIMNICTYKEYDRYFSARRLGINSGRILTGIMLKEV